MNAVTHCRNKGIKMVWEGIIEFSTVANLHSFTKAASYLDSSVAQISRKVATLEKDLGVKLFNRTTRHVSLTEAGQLYYEQCKPAIEALHNAELNVTEKQRVPTGLIKMTAPVAFGEAFIAPLINQFIKQYQGVQVECRFTNDTVDIIEQGLDLAIRIGRLEDSSLVAKKLSSRQLYVCAATEYLAKHRAPSTPQELTEHNCLVGSQAHWRFRLNGRRTNVRVNGSIKYNSGNALHDAALAGIGLVQLPGFYVRNDLASGRLLEVLSAFREERESVWALFPSNRHMAPKVRLLVNYLAEHLEDDE
jgi:DNA-binding transcriptional LysR family regulator